MGMNDINSLSRTKRNCKSILTSTILRLETTSTTSANLLSVWRKTVRPMSRSRKNSRPRKHRSIRIILMNIFGCTAATLSMRAGVPCLKIDHGKVTNLGNPICSICYFFEKAQNLVNLPNNFCFLWLII